MQHLQDAKAVCGQIVKDLLCWLLFQKHGNIITTNFGGFRIVPERIAEYEQ